MAEVTIGPKNDSGFGATCTVIVGGKQIATIMIKDPCGNWEYAYNAEGGYGGHTDKECEYIEVAIRIATKKYGKGQSRWSS